MTSNIVTLIVVLAVLLGTAAVAQEPAPRPTDYQNGTTCHAKAVKSYLAATDPTRRVDQDWNLKTAQVYQELAALGFQEC